MYPNKRRLTLAAAIIAAMVCCLAATAQTVKKERIQIAILLDTSNSMDGLIDQAKTQLWRIVNETARARKNGIAPDIEVALYEYGNDSLPESEGYIRMVIPLTADLDRISEALFKLTTNGGSEYCGTVIGRAAKALKWSAGSGDLKLIYIAGNEGFNQGDIDYKKTVKEAITKGIVVNTIFCGARDEGIELKWKDGADLADGSFMNIDQNQQVAYIEAPQDAEIERLNGELNGTYVAYGKRGAEAKTRQEAQDTNAAAMSKEAVIQRTISKGSANYKNSEWDIVDAVEDGSLKPEEMKKEDLPEEMKKMNAAERKAHIEKLRTKRADIQKKLGNLRTEREEYVRKAMQKNAAENTLDEAMVKSVRKQAEKKNYRFE